MQKIYIIKNPTPWMFDELKAFSLHTSYKILFLRTPPTSFSQEIDYLKKHGVEVYVKPFKKTFTVSEFYFCIKFTFKHLSSFVGIQNLVFGLKALVWFLRLNKNLFQFPCNIHAQFATQSSILACMLKEYLSKDSIYSFTFHAHDVYYKNRWFNLIYLNAEVIFSISDYNIKYLTANYKIHSEKLNLARLGVFKPILKKKQPGEKIYIGFLSRITEKKGLEYLIKGSVILLKMTNIPFEIIIAGDGPQKVKYEKLSCDLKVDHLISFIGSISGQQKTSFFNKINIFCLPSITIKNDMDGLPVVLMEAISYNIPIVSTRISGIPEICIDGFNGFLVNQKNAFELATKLGILINEPEILGRFTNNCQQTFKNYDILLNSKNKLNVLKWV
jgi:glycosyltransferase involved in cell wall biosynthesis